MRKLIIYLIFALFLICVVLPAQNSSPFMISVYPELTVPLGPDLAEINDESPYSTGVLTGVDLRYGLDIMDGLFAKGGLGYTFVPVKDGSAAETDNLSLIHVGAGLGYDFKLPMDIIMSLSGISGYFTGIVGEESSANIFLRTGVDFSYPVSNSYSITMGLQYGRFFDSAEGNLPNYLIDSIGFHVGAMYRSGSYTRKSLLKIIDVQIDPVYPILYGYYDENPLGTVTVQSKERGTIKDLKVSLFIPEYMDQPKVSRVEKDLKFGDLVDVPLYALLKDDILEVTEDGKKVAGEIRISYSLRGGDSDVDEAATFQVQNRNSLVWTDDRKAASFVTAKDNTVQKFAKTVAGVVRDSSSSAVDLNFRTALAMYELLGLYGMSYVVDPDSSYSELSENGAAQDYVQFPAQTLEYKAGDCDDLSILYCSLLQAVNVDTAFITVPGHIFTAFKLSLSPDEAARLFTDSSEFLEIEGEAWIPVEATVMDQGFLEAWRSGMRQVREFTEKDALAIYPVQEAWGKYIPVTSPIVPSELSIPAEGRISRNLESGMDTIVRLEVQDRVKMLERQIRDSNNNPALINKLAVLYARFGLLDDALQQLDRITRREEYAPALINTGNIQFMKKNYARALSYYDRAMQASKDNINAELGLARCHFALENY